MIEGAVAPKLRTILVVEDNGALRDVLARALRGEGYDVTTAVDGTQAIRAASRARFDAIVLDIGLPDSDGRDVCQALRARGCDAAVVFLTARGGVTDLLSGFSSGGDDYLSKPFAMAELFVRLQAVLKRSGNASLVHSDLELDALTHTMSFDGRRLELSPTEFRVLARLMSTPAVLVRRRQLVEAAWPAAAIVSDNTLDQYVRRIRRKLEGVGSGHTIRTMRGVGYSFG